MPDCSFDIPGSPLLDAWDQTLDKCANRKALLSQAGTELHTFHDLERAATALASSLHSLPRNPIIAFCADNDPLWIPAFLALLKVGASVVLLEGQASLSPSFQGLMRDLRVLAIASLREETLKLDPLAALPLESIPRPAIIKVTSGTSGTPRGIFFSATQIIADCESVCDTMGITSDDLNYGAISMAHSYGFSNLVTPLICRGVPMVVTSDRLPRSILAGIVASRATVFPATPIFFQKFNELGLDSRAGHLRLAISAGAPLAAEVAEVFWRATGHKIHAFYGSSECGGICYDGDLGTDFVSGYVGTPMKGVRIEIDEASGRPDIHGPAVGDRYYPTEEAETLSNGRFRPADLLAREGAGYRVVGRVSDLINVAGRKLNPVEVEAALLRCPGVKEAVVFGVPNEARGEMPAACVVAAGASEQQLIAHCLQILPSWQAPKFVRIVSEIPVTARGKISRAELARRFGS